MLLVVVIVVIAIIIHSIVKSGNDWRDRSKLVRVGMTASKVKSIMGEPSFVKNHQDGSYEYIYEKSEWKGWLRGGTRTRRMEIVFDLNDKAISVGKNANCDMSGW